jgi:hypothetical protein
LNTASIYIIIDDLVIRIEEEHRVWKEPGIERVPLTSFVGELNKG